MDSTSPSPASPGKPIVESQGKLPIGILEVRVHGATDLVGPYTKTKTTPNSLKYTAMNPLVKLEMKQYQHQHANTLAHRQNHAVGGASTQSICTSVQQNTQSPVFNSDYETFEFFVYSADTVLLATVLNTNDTHPFRGTVEISLEDYTAYTLGKTERKNQTFQLQRDEEHLAQDWTVTGSVELSLSYRPVEKSKVTVTVEDGKGITCAKNQMANVFVSGGIRTSSGKTLERTKIVRNENGFPVWSEQFNLEYKNALVDEAALEINIAETFTTSHQARGTFQGHPIGSLTLSMKELLQAQAQLNQSIADELLPEESILRMYHPMLNAAGESKGELYLLISVESPKIIVARKKVAVEEAVAAAKLLPKSLMEEEGLRTEERKMVTQARKGSDSGARLFNPVKLLAALGFIGGVAFECVVRSKGSSSSPPPPAAAAAKKAAAQKVAAKKVSPWDNTPHAINKAKKAAAKASLGV